MEEGRPRRGGRRLAAAPWAALALAAVLAGSAQAADPRSYADARAARPDAAVRVDRATLQRRLGDQAVIEVDARTGTPRVLARLDGSLSGPSARTPEAIASEFVRANLALLGLTRADFN